MFLVQISVHALNVFARIEAILCAYTDQIEKVCRLRDLMRLIDRDSTAGNECLQAICRSPGSRNVKHCCEL